MLTDVGKHLWEWVRVKYPKSVMPFYQKLEKVCFMDQTVLLYISDKLTILHGQSDQL